MFKNFGIRLCFSLLFTVLTTEANPIPWFSTEQYTGAHDPTIIRDERGVYSLLSTNNWLSIRQSTDLVSWRSVDRIMGAREIPSWVREELPNEPVQNFWAPHIFFMNNRYWVYYSASSWGVNQSAIGVASNPTLDYQSTHYNWTDHGLVIKSGYNDENWNCIDPEMIIDRDGNGWLFFGSFWSGIRMIAIDTLTGIRPDDDNTVHHAAQRRGGIEGPSIIEHNGYYYLFTAWDRCCAGVESTYRIMVGRSEEIHGTYRDRNGASLLQHNATEVLSTYGRYIGTGHGSAFWDGRRYYFAHHYYDGLRRGNATLHVREIVWDDEGWPHLPQPFLGRRRAYEAHHAEITNAQRLYATGAGMASDSQYVGYINYENSSVLFRINSAQEGEHLIRIRYAAGNGDASHLLRVNDNPDVEIHYPGTERWGRFPEGQTIKVPVNLKKGYNELEFRRGSLFAELDRIDLIRPEGMVIQAGSYDDGVMAEPDYENNNARLAPGGFIHYEHVDFGISPENIGIKFAEPFSGELRLSVNNVTNQDMETELSDHSEVQIFTLSEAFKNAAFGIQDFYITYPGSSGNPVLIDSFIFGDESTGIVKENRLKDSFRLELTQFGKPDLIRFHLPITTPVKIAVYSADGRLVKSLLNDTKAQGSHILPFSQHSLANGIYFLRLISGRESFCRKIAIMK